MSSRRLAIGFLALEGLAGLVWYALLLVQPQWGGVTMSAWFLPESFGAGALRTFFVADLVFFAALPRAVAVGLRGERAWGFSLLALHAGGVTYAALWGWGLRAGTGAGLSGALLMSAPAAVLLILVVKLRPPGRAELDG